MREPVYPIMFFRRDRFAARLFRPSSPVIMYLFVLMATAGARGEGEVRELWTYDTGG